MESGHLEPFGIWDPFRSTFGPEKEADSPKIIPQTHQKKIAQKIPRRFPTSDISQEFGVFFFKTVWALG